MVSRGQVFRHRLDAYSSIDGQKISLVSIAEDDAVYAKNSQFTFDGGQVELPDSSVPLPGKIEISGFGPNAIFQGDEVLVSGMLYPGLGPYQGFMSYAQITVLNRHPTISATFRRRFTASVQTVLPEPEAPFAMGLLIGQRATLPPAVKQDLLMIGLTHIIAVSGYNLTIMLNASKRLLVKRSKRLSTLLSISLIGIFLLVAGSSASIIRAAIVSMLSIATSYYGRTLKPIPLIMIAAAITAWTNPLYEWNDTSWYLSFLAFFGVLVVAPLLQQRLPKALQTSVIAAIGLESISAEAMTTPFILHSFGQLSLIGLPGNLLVAVLVPLAMLCSTIAGVAGMFAGAIAGWFAWPAKLLLIYMLDISHLLASIPKIFWQQLSFSTGSMIAWYVISMAFCTSLWFKTRLQTAILTDEEDTRQGV